MGHGDRCSADFTLPMLIPTIPPYPLCVRQQITWGAWSALDVPLGTSFGRRQTHSWYHWTGFGESFERSCMPLKYREMLRWTRPPGISSVNFASGGTVIDGPSILTALLLGIRYRRSLEPENNQSSRSPADGRIAPPTLDNHDHSRDENLTRTHQTSERHDWQHLSSPTLIAATLATIRSQVSLYRGVWWNSVCHSRACNRFSRLWREKHVQAREMLKSPARMRSGL